MRAYSQTTGAWVRGILSENFGIAPEQVHWTTFEDPHVAEYSDPPFATRAKPGSVLLDMLRAGELDAVIVGNDKPTDADLADVYPDAEEAGRQFARKHGFVPVNHVIVAKQSVVDTQRDTLMKFWDAVKSAWKDYPVQQGSADRSQRDRAERCARAQVYLGPEHAAAADDRSGCVGGAAGRVLRRAVAPLAPFVPAQAGIQSGSDSGFARFRGRRTTKRISLRVEAHSDPADRPQFP